MREGEETGRQELGRAVEGLRQKQRQIKVQLPSAGEAAWKNNCREETEESH